MQTSEPAPSVRGYRLRPATTPYIFGPSKSPHPPKGFHRAGEIVKSTTDKSIVTTNNFDPAGGTVQSHPPTRRMSAYVHACDVFVDGSFSVGG